MRRPLHSWKNLLGKLGLQVVDKPISHSRMRHTQRQLTVESLERRDLMATLYWDTNGSTSGLGGAGTWDLTAANWTTDPTGSSTTQTWNNTAGDDAVFAGTGASVTIGSGIQASSLKIESSGYTLGSGSLAVNGTGEVNVATSISATISSQLTGSTELLKTGAGSLTLSGSNTLSGGTQIDAGTLRLTNTSGAGSGTIELGNGTLSLYRSGATTTYANAITSLSGSTGTLTVDGSGSNAGTGTNSTYGTGTLTVNGTLTVSRSTGGTGNTFFTGQLAGSGILKIGNTNGGTAPSTSAFGRARFDNTSNTFAGEVNVLSGGNFLNMTLLSTYSTVNLASGGYITLLGDTTTTVGSLTGSGTVTKNISATTTAELVVGAGDASGTFSGVIGQTALSATGIVSLKKIGTGTATLSGTNTFTGSTTIDAGTLRLTNVSGAGTGTINIGNGTLSLSRSGATTTYANTITSLTGTSGTLTVDGSGTNATPSGTNSTYGTGTITVDGTLTVSRPTGGTGHTFFTGLLAGNGILKVANNNGGTAPSTSAIGRARFDNTGNTFAGEVDILSGGNFLNMTLNPAYSVLDVASGGYLTLLGNTTTTVGSLTGGGTITKSVVADTATLTIGSGNASSTFSGVIGQSALSAIGTVALNKIGTGTVTLSGANTYTGSTTIDGGGTVIVSNNNNNGISKLGKGTLTVKNGSTLQVAGTNALGTGSNKPDEVSLESGSTLTTANSITAQLPHVTLNGSTIASGTPNTSSGSWAFMNGIDVESLTTSLITASNMYLAAAAPINIAPESTLALGGEFDNTPSRGASTYSVTGDGRLYRYGELVLNRSFEQPNVATGSHSHLSSIPGWELARGTYFEIQDNISGLGGASDGSQHLELDSNNTSSDVKQTLSVMPGSVYTVRFDYRGRPNRTTSDNTMVFEIRDANDVVVKTETLTTSDTTNWSHFTYNIQALTEEFRIIFKDNGTWNSYGMFIDNVSCKLDLTIDPGVAIVSVQRVGEAGVEPGFGNVGRRDAGFVVTRQSQPGSEDDYSEYYKSSGVAEQYSHPLTVNYEFADASVNPATFGTDYNAYYINEAGNEVSLGISGTLTIPAGKQSVKIVIRPLFDLSPTEGLENVRLVISKPNSSDPTISIYNDQDETGIIDYTKWIVPVCVTGDCPCACAQANSNPAGDIDASSNGSLLGPQSGTTPNVQTPAKIATFSTWSSVTAIRARLTLGSAVSADVFYDPASVTPGDDVWLNLFVDASGETSGVKDWTIDLDYLDGSGNVLHADDFTGLTTVYNRLESEFGKRWWRSDLDQLVVDSNYATVFSANGQIVSFYVNGSDFLRATASTEDVQLASSGSNYLLSDKYGNQTLFNSAGRMLSNTTATGLVTTYAYVSGNPDLLETVTTPDGDVTRYAYETYASGTKWRVATMVQHDQSLNSVTTEFSYNSTSDNLLTQTVRTTADMTPVIKTETYAYDPTTSLLTDITDSESNTTTITYDFAGRIDKIERACGGTTAHDPFRSVGLVDVAVVGGTTSNLAAFVKVDDSAAVGYNEDERGNPTFTRMDDQGRVIWEQDAQGNVTSFNYDQDGNLLSMIAADPDGAGALEAVETVSTYDAFGNRISQVERTAVSQVVLSTQSWTYDPVFGAMTSSTDELGRVTKYLIGRAGGDINDDGRVLAEIRIVGLDDRSSGETDDVTTSYTYGSVSYGSLVVGGLLTSVTDANDHTTTYEYFDNVAPSTGKLGLLQKIINPDATFRSYDYDAHGNRTSETDELGRTTTYSYDGEDRLISRTDPDPDGAGPLAAPTWSYEYDTNDNQTKIVDPLGRETIMVYNNRTWLAQRIEEGGVTTSYTYNCVGDMTTMTDPLGRVTTYAYNNLNQQISVTLPDPDGAGPLTSPVMSTTYDALGRTKTTTDANGNVTTYGYDQHGHQSTVTLADPDGAGLLAAPVYTSVYDDAGQLLSSIDPLGRTTTYGYDDLGRQVTVTMPDPDGAGPLAAPIMTTTYDKVGNVLTRTDALGNVTSYAYDDRDRTISVTMADPDGVGPQSAPVMLTVYDDAGQVTSTTDALGRVTTYDYDNLGRRISVTLPDPDGAGSLAAPVMTTVYDVASQVTSTTDALGHVTSYEYDDLGRQTKVIQPDPDGAGPLAAPEWTTVYDDAGQVTSTTDPLGRTTTYEYDNLGRTISVTQPDPDGAGALTAPVFTTSYDANGNVLTSTDALGNVTSYTYDALNRRTLTTQADPDGAGALTAPVWETVYDVASQVTASIDPLGRTTTYEFDGLSRQTKVTSPDPDGAGSLTAAFTVTTYDIMGNVLSTADALSHTTSYEYDNLYRLIAITNANLEETTFTYDLVGNRLTLTDPNGNTTEWEYDDLNRVVLETNELNKTRSYVYDVGSRLTSKIDRLGREVEYAYDNLNRVNEELWDTVSAYTWTYDAAGQMLTGGNAATREYVYSYDSLGRVTQIDTNEFGSSSVYDLNFTYDANGNRLTRSHAASTATWSYDFLNRAKDVTATGAVGTYGAVFGYNAAGQMTFQENSDASVNSGIPFSRSEYAYDGAGRLLEIAHKDASNNPFASYGYTWDASDRITAVDFLDGVYDNEDVDYAYDAAGQVTGADRTGSGTDETYDYDTNGNRESVTRDGATATWGVDTNNQLTSDGMNSYTYDDEGNLTSDGVSTYYWDHRNRLIEVRTGSTGVMFTYDHNNLRVGKTLDLDGDWDYNDSAELDTQTSYYFDGGRMAREVSADATVENNYLFGINGQLIAVEDVANDVVEFAYNDHLGSVRDVIFADAGTVVHAEHNAYDSFGRVVERQQFDGSVWNIVTSDSIVSLGYTGEYFEVTTGLQYNWNRWYNASTGRWISEDPIGFDGGTVNLYEYVRNSTVSQIDFSGLYQTSIPSPYASSIKATYDIYELDIYDPTKTTKDSVTGTAYIEFVMSKNAIFRDECHSNVHFSISYRYVANTDDVMQAHAASNYTYLHYISEDVPKREVVSSLAFHYAGARFDNPITPENNAGKGVDVSKNIKGSVTIGSIDVGVYEVEKTKNITGQVTIDSKSTPNGQEATHQFIDYKFDLKCGFITNLDINFTANHRRIIANNPNPRQPDLKSIKAFTYKKSEIFSGP